MFVAWRPPGCLPLVALPVASVPASAQTEIWSATLTVDAFTNAAGYSKANFRHTL